MARRMRSRLPAAVSSRLSLEPGERPLAWAAGAGGSWYIGTDRALHIVAADDDVTVLGWESIERAEWNADTAMLAIIEVAGWGEVEPRTELPLDEAGRLLDLVRERVTKSVLINQFTAVQGRRGLSVVGRQSPTGEGPVSWSYVLTDGLDPLDPLVAQVAEQALMEAQREVSHL